jgi:hypothetical protein
MRRTVKRQKLTRSWIRGGSFAARWNSPRQPHQRGAFDLTFMVSSLNYEEGFGRRGLIPMRSLTVTKLIAYLPHGPTIIVQPPQSSEFLLQVNKERKPGEG